MAADLNLGLTKHATQRMTRRGITPAAIDLVMTWGRIAYIRGAIIHALGRKEVATCRDTCGLDLSRCEGVHVVCSDDGDVMTVYRNKDLRGLRRQGSRYSKRSLSTALVAN